MELIFLLQHWFRRGWIFSNKKRQVSPWTTMFACFYYLPPRYGANSQCRWSNLFYYLSLRTVKFKLWEWLCRSRWQHNFYRSPELLLSSQLLSSSLLQYNYGKNILTHSAVKASPPSTIKPAHKLCFQTTLFLSCDSQWGAGGGGPPLAALLWGRHYGLSCRL